MSRTTEPLRIGILSFAHPHVEAYARSLVERGIEVVGTDLPPYDAGTQRGAALAERLGIEYLDDVDAVLARAPHGVIVTAENARHRELVLAAIAAGAHVLCEKPIATEVGDALAMVDAADAAGVSLMTAYPVRFAPSFRELVARVRAGQLGEIVAVSGTNNGKIPLDRSWFTNAAAAGGGALVDHVVHCADLLDELLGEPAQEVYATTNRILHADRGVAVETGGVVSIAYPSGVIATIDCSWSQPDSAATWGGLTLEVHGTNGSMRIDPFAAHLSGYAEGGATWDAFGTDLDGLMIDEFLGAIRESRAPSPDGSVGVRTLAIVDAAKRSVRSGTPVGVLATA
ncbi:Gfo/Idh/MocA family protein [Agromyces cerinus]|uniref:Predicted dehydrogenase n=1 Tax=Agromyces cerinus subsp. cerinus TaxID=232089 RepID=A0A1N6FC58_9MICO|nr:Gfo/Idh/MocA family oxidoreductase [Agromyces cerinus]SIN92832.1 Predicted dehydrogenase [Agromyces cerinus subsp. cerinus]